MIQSKKIKRYRKLKALEEFLDFKEKLGLDPYEITCDEQDIIRALQFAFEDEIIHTQYCIDNKRLDFYLPKYKVGIEIDEYDHKYRDSKHEQSRNLMIENYGITVIRTNPDAIKKQTKESTKKSLIVDLSKRLLELEFNSNNSIKSYCLKWIVKKILPTIQDKKNTQSKIKPIKTGKEIGTTYCLGCKDYTHTFKAQDVKMTNKVLKRKIKLCCLSIQ